jgi:hypothetical protein
MFFLLFTFCSVRVRALVIVLSDRRCEKKGKWETCPILKQDIVFARLAGTFVTKTATLLLVDVSRVTVCEVMSAEYTFHGKTISAKRNSGRKSTLKGKDRRALRKIVSNNQNCGSIDDRSPELNIHSEDTVPTKIVRRELHKSNIHGRTAVAKPLITEEIWTSEN